MPQHGKQGWTVLFPRGEQRPQDTLLVVTAEGVELSRGSVLDPLVADAQRVYGHLAAAGIEKCRDGLADAPAQVLEHSDELKAIGVNCPRSTTLMNRLRAEGLYAGAPVRNVREAREALKEVLA